MDRGAWWATYSPWSCQESETTEQLNHHQRPLQVDREREDAGRECPCPPLLHLSMNFFFQVYLTSSDLFKSRDMSDSLLHPKQPAWPRLSVQGWLGEKRGWEYPAGPEYTPGTPGANLLWWQWEQQALAGPGRKTTAMARCPFPSRT